MGHGLGCVSVRRKQETLSLTTLTLVNQGTEKVLAGRILSAPAGLRLLEAKTQTGTKTAADGCRERWRTEDDDSERQP
jgi:hypothetical protein